MTRQVVPLQPVPNQTLQVQLGQQPCVINVYQQAYGLFVDLYVGNSLIECGVIAQNLNRIVRDGYLGFVGELAFLDSQATGDLATDPIYTGLGSRYQLLYFEPSDLPAGEG
jgi:hypothetical protein